MVSWSDQELAEVTLLELTLIHDMYMVTQCLGKLRNGSEVMVSVPFVYLPRYGLRQVIVKQAKDAGVYAKGLKIFEAIRTRISSTP